MTEDAHAEHRPPVDEDPSQVGRAVPTKLGQFYPLDDILAVVDDRAAAERAVQALKDAGVSDSNVDLLDGAWFAEAMRSARRQFGVARPLCASGFGVSCFSGMSVTSNPPAATSASIVIASTLNSSSASSK